MLHQQFARCSSRAAEAIILIVVTVAVPWPKLQCEGPLDAGDSLGPVERPTADRIKNVGWSASTIARSVHRSNRRYALIRQSHILLVVIRICMRGVAPREHPELRVAVKRDVCFDQIFIGQQEIGQNLRLDLAECRRAVVDLAARICARAHNVPFEVPVAVRVDTVAAIPRSGTRLSPKSVGAARKLVAVGVDRWGNPDVDGVDQSGVVGVRRVLGQQLIDNVQSSRWSDPFSGVNTGVKEEIFFGCPVDFPILINWIGRFSCELPMDIVLTRSG